jgi:hypothetical protein
MDAGQRLKVVVFLDGSGVLFSAYAEFMFGDADQGL